MTAARSPDGQVHPGEIVQDDKVEGRTWTSKASEVPVSIAWVQRGEAWVPVVRIEITGAGNRREITKFGPGGTFLETTVATLGPAPRPAPTPPQPAPSN